MTEKILEGVAPWQTWGTVPATFMPTLQAAGTDISLARLAAILGHAFTFSMNGGGGETWQLANIEWSLMFGQMELLPYEFEGFSAILKGAQPPPSPVELAALKERTWQSVTSSIDRGVPAVAWNARTIEQRDGGLMAGEWSLIVGYDAADKSYVLRSQFFDDRWRVPFDGFGYADPVQWFCVLAAVKPRTVDTDQVTRRCLAQARNYAHGTRFDRTKAACPVGAVGFAAYELWKDALSKGDASANMAGMHASFLTWSRQRAGEYFREIDFPAPAEHYETEVTSLKHLETVCNEARDSGSFTTGARYEAIRHLEAALAAERKAIGVIEEMLTAS